MGANAGQTGVAPPLLRREACQPVTGGRQGRAERAEGPGLGIMRRRDFSITAGAGFAPALGPRVRKHPVATKRALRAIVKAASICSLEPERVARLVVDRAITRDYGYTVDAIRALPYGRWSELDAADTVRFWALRLREAGMLKATPQKVLAEGSDWRFLTELRKELQG